ncbi:hypothetical protein BX600DRAFT_266147 [Xylariales sp. PMI_506]|nr:hypothetical protein BX600DRAFT_266147 [Xylariales sp. PMI_506]
MIRPVRRCQSCLCSLRQLCRGDLVFKPISFFIPLVVLVSHFVSHISFLALIENLYHSLILCSFIFARGFHPFTVAARRYHMHTHMRRRKTTRASAITA